NPSGIRLGTPALTSRRMKEKEMKTIGNWIATVLKDINNEELKAKTKQEVLDLTHSFPLYEEL
ncbi:MAG: serine hydroxymethyltransferase, partial [Candidatus Jacksonbacteria bacterium]|nr:serine hydroxymethyltransferase [Candidatus Jacksonbacteria bacterium]